MVSEQIRLGKLDEFEMGSIAIREVAGRSVGIFRDGDSLYGILNVCPHKGAPICQGTISGTMLPAGPGEFIYGLQGVVVRCPWHGWEYDAHDGRSIGPVDRRSLTMLDVCVVDGEVFVQS
jgi:nitrite reductase/ring-hydroxylating ferredoxin subunit